MRNEIKRLTEMLAKEDPRTPNYGVILENLSSLRFLANTMGEAAHPCKCGADVPAVNPTEPANTEPEVVAEGVSVVPTTPEAVEEEPVTPVEEEETEEYTIEEVRQAIKEAQARGVDARPFIAAYGVKNLSGVPKESYGALIREVANA